MADTSVHSPSRKHMPDSVRTFAIAIAAVAVAAAIAFSAVVGFVLLHVGEGSTPAAAHGAEPGRPPSITGSILLQPEPAQDIAAYRTEKQRLLSEYAWVDREHGVVRIPIEQAMKLLVRERNSAAKQ